MKIPLRFQIMEFDCGTVTLQNAISYMFEREDIPAEIIRAISIYTLDCYDKSGNIGQGGTSKEAVNMMSNWITNYTNSHDFKVKVKNYVGSDVNIEVIKEAINNHGCVVLRTYEDGEHYILITNVDSNYVYLWDPYYLDQNYYAGNTDIEIILNNLFYYNRRVTIKRFLSEDSLAFSLGPISNRECLTFIK